MLASSDQEQVKQIEQEMASLQEELVNGVCVRVSHVARASQPSPGRRELLHVLIVA